MYADIDNRDATADTWLGSANARFSRWQRADFALTV